MTDINPLEQLETRGGAPRPIPKRGPKPTEGEIRTVVYFMPDGDALIRYEAIDSRWATNSFYARSAFLILAVIPSVNGGAPSVQFLKSKIDLSALLKGAVNSYMFTPENEIELAQKVLGLSKGEVETLIDRANVPDKLKPERRDPDSEDCGDCEGCLKTYVSDDPSTHCINCTCIMCIPGG